MLRDWPLHAEPLRLLPIAGCVLGEADAEMNFGSKKNVCRSNSCENKRVRSRIAQRELSDHGVDW